MRAAYELIQRNGSKETSVHDVLHATGFSTRAFYRHFHSKDELVVEMYRIDSDRVAENLTAAVASAPTPFDALEAWIDQNLAVVYDARRLRHAVVLSSPEVASVEGYTEVHIAGMAADGRPWWSCCARVSISFSPAEIPGPLTRRDHAYAVVSHITARSVVHGRR